MEGRREIEASKLRLTAAKRQLSSAEQMMEAAKKMMASATKEVQDAQSFLKEIEKRWEVISIDVDDAGDIKSPGAEDSHSSKKRKVSVTPRAQGNGAARDNSNNSAAGAAAAATSIRQSNENEHTNTRRTTAAVPQENVRQATVTGVQANGTTAQATARQSSNNVTSDSNQANAVQAVRRSNANNAVQSNPRRSRRLGGALALQLKQKKEEYEAAANKHRDETLRLLRESARKGQPSVPAAQMEEARCRSVESMKAADLEVSRAGGTKKNDSELTARMAKAEADAVQIYVDQHVNRSRTTSTTNAQPAGARTHTIDVSGCGISGANGTYGCEDPLPSQSPSVLSDGVPIYNKQGTWRGETVKFTIYRKVRGGSKYWFIGVSGYASSTQLLYKVIASGSSGRHSWPPFSGWVATAAGANPAPKLKLV